MTASDEILDGLATSIADITAIHPVFSNGNEVFILGEADQVGQILLREFNKSSGRCLTVISSQVISSLYSVLSGSMTMCSVVFQGYMPGTHQPPPELSAKYTSFRWGLLFSVTTGLIFWFRVNISEGWFIALFQQHFERNIFQPICELLCDMSNMAICFTELSLL